MKKNKFFLCIFLFTSQINTQESICDQQCINRIQLFLDAQFTPQFKNFLNTLFKVTIKVPTGSVSFITEQSGALLQAFATILGVPLPNTIDDSKDLPTNVQILKNNFDTIYQAATQQNLPSNLIKFEVKPLASSDTGTITVSNKTNISWKGILSSGEVLTITQGKKNYQVKATSILFSDKPSLIGPSQLLYDNDSYTISNNELKNEATHQIYPLQKVVVINTLNTY